VSLCSLFAGGVTVVVEGSAPRDFGRPGQTASQWTLPLLMFRTAMPALPFDVMQSNIPFPGIRSVDPKMDEQVRSPAVLSAHATQGPCPGAGPDARAAPLQIERANATGPNMAASFIRHLLS